MNFYEKYCHRAEDGFYYFLPPVNSGFYAAHTLREIADFLDKVNKPWSDQIDNELNTHNQLHLPL